MKKAVILIISTFFALIVSGLVGILVFCQINLGPVDKKDTSTTDFEVTSGSALNTVIANLKKEDLIKNEMILKVYSKLHSGTPKAGIYTISKSMSAKEIYNKIINGDATFDTVWVTFVEGKRLTYIASKIADNFDYTYDEVMNTLDDKEYVKELIGKYDFLTDDILNDKIYHPLEGYLFADTYEFLKNSSIKNIIESMLNNTKIKLSNLKADMDDSNYSIHEIMTLASIVELEGARSDDRAGVAGVFYNRLKNHISLGSDVTTYYAVNKDFSEDLRVSELNSCNGYNTRGNCVIGLPVGPIASPSIESIKAALNPTEHDYIFFVADKNGKTYFSKTNSEHINTINRLKRENLWYEY